jgi:hypothetical protein
LLAVIVLNKHWQPVSPEALKGQAALHRPSDLQRSNTLKLVRLAAALSVTASQ